MEVVEPYLMQLGFLARTPRGRIATPQAYEYFKVPFSPNSNPQPALFEP